MKKFFSLVMLLCVTLISAQEFSMDLVKNMKPRNIGPGGMSGRVTAIDVVTSNPDIMYVSGQGAQYAPSDERGIYRTMDGGKNWKRVLFVNNTTGASSLSMNMNNPRILYAAMWQHQRYPWYMESGGENSGLYKSIDGGDTWTQMKTGLPKEFGKSGISVSRANSERVYAVIEAEGKKGGSLPFG